MKIASLLLPLLFIWNFPGTANASSNTENLSVKITSYDSDAPSVVFKGSGTLFSFNGKTYVLTSEHVVLHEITRNKMHIRNDSIGSIPARLIAVDFSVGLAILQVDSLSATNIPTSANLFSQKPTEYQDAITLAGFPYNSSTLVQDTHGQVIDPASDRAFIPAINSMIETVGANGEFGMSGSAVWNTDQKIVGVLSHQFLRITDGVTQVGEFSASSSTKENHLLTIPSSAVSKWVSSVLSGKKTCSDALRDTRLQIRGIESVLVDQHRLTFSAEKDSEKHPVGGSADGRDGHGTKIGGKDGHGIGGSADGKDGHGIGGSADGRDGHGIGGNDDSESEMFISISLLKGSESTEIPLCKNASITSRLSGLESISAFLSYDQDRMVIDTKHFTSLADATKRLWFSREIPVPANSGTSPADVPADELKWFSETVLGLSQDLTAMAPTDLKSAKDAKYPQLIAELVAISRLAQTEAGLFALRNELIISQVRAQDSSRLFKDNWDQAIRLWSFLEIIEHSK